jgi:putative transposase
VGVSRSCYYEFKYHVPSDRQIRRLLVSGLVADIHKRSRGTYGMLRIRAPLRREQNMVVNKKLILSIMRELGIKGLPGPKKRRKNLVNQATEEDLVQRNFTVDRPNVLWLTDITEHPTREGKVYCCVVLDAFSRRVVGWAIDRRCETALVNDAVVMAAESRKTGPGSIIHSWGFSELIRTMHLVGSMGTVGDCYDNAPMESFWGSMQIELLNRKKWRTKIELSIAMAEWIEHFYNPERLHSSLGYLPPVEFEELHMTANQA